MSQQWALRIEQNPRCPPGGHLEFWAAMVFEKNLRLVKPNPQKIISAYPSKRY
jgi:hypothetical protein